MTSADTTTPDTDAMAFGGFPTAALDFYEALEADNTKAFWTDNREVYEAAVRTPLLALCDAMAAEFGPAKVFRPYRDVRFSKDKSPYKTAQGAVLGMSEGAGALYVQVSAAGLMVAAGYYEMASDQVQRYREAVDDPSTGEQLREVITAVETAGHSIGGDRLKTRPKGYPEDHPRLDLLRYRTLTAVHTYPPEPWLHTAEAADVIAATWREMTPLNRWLESNVGASRTERR
jgi:uncharacterized protein (TIGR02453 family)